MSGKWSAQAWQSVEPIYSAIIEMPFVRELSQGTLSKDVFMGYLRQDALYVNNYCRVLAHIASRLTDSDLTAEFLTFASDGVAVERALHESFLGPDALKGVEPSPTCQLYMSYERAAGFAPVEVEVAAVLPCFWVYQRVGSHILAQMRPGNPYERWIQTYGDPVFELSTRRAIEIADKLAEATTPDIKTLMTEAFVKATRMEWMFFDSAYNSEKWKI